MSFKCKRGISDLALLFRGVPAGGRGNWMEGLERKIGPGWIDHGQADG